MRQSARTLCRCTCRCVEPASGRSLGQLGCDRPQELVVTVEPRERGPGLELENALTAGSACTVGVARGRKPPLRLLPVTAREARGRAEHSETGTTGDGLRWELDERVVLGPVVLHGDDVPGLGGDLVGEIPVTTGQRVPERGHRLVRLPVPAGAEPLQQPEVVRPRPSQLRAQELEQQSVVAIPDLGAGVAGHEEVRGRELGQHPAAVAPAGQGVRQLSGDRVGHRGAEEKLPQPIGLTVEDLVQQIVGHGAVVPGEAAQEAGAVGLRGKGQRGEADAGSPPLGPPVQRLDVARCEFGRERLQGLAALLECEGQVGGTDLREVVGEAQSLQAQARVGPGRDHQSKRRRPVEQRLQFALDDRALDLVKVVEHEHDRLGAIVEALRDLRNVPVRRRSGDEAHRRSRVRARRRARTEGSSCRRGRA